MIANLSLSLPGAPTARPPAANDIIALVAQRFGVKSADLTGPSRFREIAQPRQIAMHLIRKLRPRLTLEAIGGHLGNRDHTTVMHGLKCAAKLIAADPRLAQSVEAVERQIRTNFTVG